MRIKPIFTTTIVKDTYNADGSLWMPKGSNLAFCSTFNSKKFGKFSVLAPNPVHLFIANVDHLAKELNEVSENINKSDKIIVFSKLVNGVNKFSTDELLKLDPEATQQRKLDEELLYKYLYLSASCLVALIAAIEAFVNQELPKDYEFSKATKEGGIKVLKKQEIETGLRLEEKIELLADSLNIANYKQQNFWQEYKNIKRIRDNLVHLKTKGSDLVNRNDTLFGDLFELEITKARETIVTFLNYFIKDYIQD